MERLRQDLADAARLVRRFPGTSLTAAGCLALGIGVAVAAFDFARTTVLRRLPVAEVEGLVSVFTTDPRWPGRHPASYLDYRDFRDDNPAFAGLLVSLPFQVPLGGGAVAERVRGELVSGNYFAVLGVEPWPGRGFLPDEDRTPGTHPVAVVSHAAWIGRFAGDRGLVGRSLSLGGHRFQVVGVAPPGFGGLRAGAEPELWVPAMMHAQVLSPTDDSLHRRRALNFSVVGRLRPGVSLGQARDVMADTARRLALAHPDTRGRGFVVEPLDRAGLDPGERPSLARAAALLLAAAFVVLAALSAQLSDLQLARAHDRRKEVAVRALVGATPVRLARHVLLANLGVALIAGAAGSWLASRWVPALWALAPDPSFAGHALVFDGRMWSFVLAVSLLAGLISALVPALRAARIALADVRDGAVSPVPAPRMPGLRGLLLSVQVAVCLVLLLSAGSLARGLGDVYGADPGFRTHEVAAVPLELDRNGYSESRARVVYRELLERVREAPAVRAASLARHTPSQAGTPKPAIPLGVPGAAARVVDENVVTPGYFDVLGISLTAGRDFDERDQDASPAVAMVSESLAQGFWPDRDAVGQRIRFWDQDGDREVVGVVPDVSRGSPWAEPRPTAYLPLAQNQVAGVHLVTHVQGDPAALAARVERTSRLLDGGPQVFPPVSFAEGLTRALWRPRLAAAVLGVFGLLGLCLAGVGLHAALAHDLNRRWREIGLRLALGSTRGRIRTLVLCRGVVPLAAGLGLGLAVAALLRPALGRLVRGAPAADLSTLVGTPLALLVVAVAAAYVPVRDAGAMAAASALGDRQEENDMRVTESRWMGAGER